MHVKQKKKVYIECKRCSKNNWDSSKFWGCPRGGCEVEDKGKIVIVKTLNKNE